MKKVSIDNNSLAHTSWNSKYHIVFAPKYRRKVFFAEKRLEIREIMRQLCQWKGSRNNRGRVVSRPHTYAGEYPAQNERFGIHGLSQRKKCIVDISEIWEHEVCIPKPRIWLQGILRRYRGKNTKAIKEYISEQLKRGQESDQLAMFDSRDPFMGSK